MVVFRLIFSVVAAACVGCASTQAPPTQAELDEYEHLCQNEERAVELLAAGEIRAGEQVEDVLRLFKPYRIDFSGRYAFIEFFPVPNLHGLSLIAVDGQLVWATRWNCTTSEVFFETFNDDEKRAAFAAYESRLFGDPR
jgi:hypothetical protein